MQAEKRGFSWAHWNMYSNIDTAKGMGPWEWVIGKQLNQII